MAKIVPELNEVALAKLRQKSKAEARVYQQCAALGADFLVLFSVPWISVTAYGTPKDGETDFIVFHPHKGVLIIEVKGGGVAFEPISDSWTSRDGNGNEHQIKNPFRQATSSKNGVRTLRDRFRSTGNICTKLRATPNGRVSGSSGLFAFNDDTRFTLNVHSVNGERLCKTALGIVPCSS